ncbi:hypothetical protein BKA93DRAFT_491460 [Sparassis latifolia]
MRLPPALEIPQSVTLPSSRCSSLSAAARRDHVFELFSRVFWPNPTEGTSARTTGRGWRSLTWINIMGKARPCKSKLEAWGKECSSSCALSPPFCPAISDTPNRFSAEQTDLRRIGQAVNMRSTLRHQMLATMSPFENHKHIPQAMKELIGIFSALFRVDANARTLDVSLHTGYPASRLRFRIWFRSFVPH